MAQSVNSANSNSQSNRRAATKARHWRQLAGLSIRLIIICALVWFAWFAYTINLVNTRFFTGWSLFAVVALLMLLSARKKLPFLRVGNTTRWLKVHVFIGLFAGFLFGIHIGFRWPNGWLDIMLALVFALVFLSGLVGWYLTRSIPGQLRTRGQPILRNRIPTAVRTIARDVDDIVRNSVVEANSEVIPHLHSAHLMRYFSRAGSGRLPYSADPDISTELLNRITGLQRFASDREAQMLGQIADLVVTKRDLDFQYSRQNMLLAWLFVHVPFSYSLLFLMIAHLVVAYMFRGAAL